MVGIVITGHNGIAQGVENAVRLLAGDYPYLKSVDFMAGEGEDELEKKLVKARSEMEECSQLLVLCDIMGGSPFKKAYALFYRDPSVKIFYGMNLPMAVECVFRAMEQKTEWDLDTEAEGIKELLMKHQGSISWPESG